MAKKVIPETTAVETPAAIPAAVGSGNTLILKLILAACAVTGVVLVGVIVVATVVLVRNNQSNGTTTNPVIPTASISITPSPTPVVTSMFSGKLTRLNQDLGLFMITQDQKDMDKANASSEPATYYTAGTYLTGQYQGYQRIIATRSALVMGDDTIFILATKDMKTYVVDGNPSVDMFTNPASDYNFLDTGKVTAIVSLPSEHPRGINLDSNFMLIKDVVPDQVADEKVNGITIYRALLTMDYSLFLPITYDQSDLKFYSEKVTANNFLDIKSVTAAVKYIGTTTATYVVDSTGFSFKYELATKKNADTYNTEMTKYLTDLAKYNQFYLNPANINKMNPGQYPDVPQKPNLRFKKSDTTITQNTYDVYDVAFPGACSYNVNTYVAQGLVDTDLVKIGDLNGIALYTLKDSNHALNVFAHDNKANEQSYIQEPGDALVPAISVYVAKTPLILMKDTFGRWDILGEWDYLLPGGCGKPVVYLYPTKPTQVSVNLTAPVDFTTTIPSYQNGWRVLAETNGVLHDLQSQFTDCNNFSTAVGSEYAKSACLSNNYPYLYWAGNVQSINYPSITSGWIVAKQDLSVFMNSKLDEVGLTTQEKSDMLSYWLPEMLKANMPYYRISFLQTREMNKIAPMHISPQPDSVNRIFLDYLPLAAKPATPIAPEKLEKFVRDGFTVVEWGGKKL